MAECARCGGFVTADYERVCGDNTGAVRDCPNCPRETVGEDADDGGSAGVPLRDIDTSESASPDAGEASTEATSPTTEEAEPGENRSRFSRVIDALALG